MRVLGGLGGLFKRKKIVHREVEGVSNWIRNEARIKK